MNAKDARNLASSVLTGENNSQLSEILSDIKTAANKGEFETWYYKDIHPLVRSTLIDRGYGVEPTQFERNETMTKIKW